ncbi:hypothetical protein [Nocardia tenerifensis]|nr:hypothetical protein [Nocardia tenerifensis]
MSYNQQGLGTRGKTVVRDAHGVIVERDTLARYECRWPFLESPH